MKPQRYPPGLLGPGEAGGGRDEGAAAGGGRRGPRGDGRILAGALQHAA